LESAADKPYMDIAAAAASSGLQQAESRVIAIAGKIASEGGNAADSSDSVDLSTQAVALIQARDDFAANIGTLKIVDQMQKSLFDLLG
jgi:flagellar hook protein FlgE